MTVVFGMYQKYLMKEVETRELENIIRMKVGLKVVLVMSFLYLLLSVILGYTIYKEAYQVSYKMAVPYLDNLKLVELANETDYFKYIPRINENYIEIKENAEVSFVDLYENISYSDFMSFTNQNHVYTLYHMSNKNNLHGILRVNSLYKRISLVLFLTSLFIYIIIAKKNKYKRF